MKLGKGCRQVPRDFLFQMISWQLTSMRWRPMCVGCNIWIISYTKNGTVPQATWKPDVKGAEFSRMIFTWCRLILLEFMNFHSHYFLSWSSHFRLGFRHGTAVLDPNLEVWVGKRVRLREGRVEVQILSLLFLMPIHNYN